MKGKNGPTPFWPLKDKTGGKINYIQNKEAMCLTERQADHVYKVVEKGNMINNNKVLFKYTENSSGKWTIC